MPRRIFDDVPCFRGTPALILPRYYFFPEVIAGVKIRKEHLRTDATSTPFDDTGNSEPSTLSCVAELAMLRCGTLSVSRISAAHHFITMFELDVDAFCRSTLTIVGGAFTKSKIF